MLGALWGALGGISILKVYYLSTMKTQITKGGVDEAKYFGTKPKCILAFSTHVH